MVRAVHPEGGDGQRFVQKRAVVWRGYSCVRVATEEATGHTHAGHSNRPSLLKALDETHQEEENCLLLARRNLGHALSKVSGPVLQLLG